MKEADMSLFQTTGVHDNNELTQILKDGHATLEFLQTIGFKDGFMSLGVGLSKEFGGKPALVLMVPDPATFPTQTGYVLFRNRQIPFVVTGMPGPGVISAKSIA
jgi:hypothetical protein